MLPISELLEYALSARVPQAFVDRLVSRQSRWDDEFIRQLDELAYEFRPDLAVWQLSVDSNGRLVQLRLAPTITDLS